MRASRGASLVELVLTMALGSVVLMAAGRLALSVRRFWFAERDAIAMRQALRSAAGVLSSELRATAPASGDLLRGSDTSVTLRAPRGLYMACAVESGGTTVIVRRDETLAPGALEAGRESVLVYLAAEPDSADRWLHAGLTDVGGAACPEGWSAYALSLAPAHPESAAAFAGIQPGAAVRLFETLTYRLYADGAGQWWLGVKSFQDGGWTATSPLAGPFQARTGLAFTFRGPGGAATAAGTSTRSIEIVLRTVGRAPIAAAGWRDGVRTDSLAAVVAPRNQ